MELKRISQANLDMLDATDELLKLFGELSDEQQKQRLQAVIARLITDSNAISAAIQSTAYVAASA
jgi:type VI protein secretion system component VasF